MVGKLLHNQANDWIYGYRNDGWCKYVGLGETRPISFYIWHGAHGVGTLSTTYWEMIHRDILAIKMESKWTHGEYYFPDPSIEDIEDSGVHSTRIP